MCFLICKQFVEHFTWSLFTFFFNLSFGLKSELFLKNKTRKSVQSSNSVLPFFFWSVIPTYIGVLIESGGLEVYFILLKIVKFVMQLCEKKYEWSRDFLGSILTV